LTAEFDELRSLLEFSFSRCELRTYTFSQARQQLATLLDEASREGEVRICRRDGRSFVVQPLVESRSPLDVPGLSTGLTTAEILDLVREGRRPRRPRRVKQEAPAAPKGATTPRGKRPRTGSASR
jgi:antitoxin (DNA-binding transcriptional repressor) of toxin-antitoxin stability system